VHLKVDEDLPRAVASLLREAGYEEVRTVTEQGMGGWTFYSWTRPGSCPLPMS
jgi:hypothetical protein